MINMLGINFMVALCNLLGDGGFTAASWIMLEMGISCIHSHAHVYCFYICVCICIHIMMIFDYHMIWYNYMYRIWLYDMIYDTYIYIYDMYHMYHYVVMHAKLKIADRLESVPTFSGKATWTTLKLDNVGEWGQNLQLYTVYAHISAQIYSIL